MSPILLAKKSEGDVRFYIDYRRLNALTKKDVYPILLIAETLEHLKKAKIFIKINICQTFHKLRMATSSKNLTVMATQFGAYKRKVMLFRLIGSPASWQHSINDVLWEYLNKFCTTYLDNILIYRRNIQEHKKYVHLVLAKLREFVI